MLARTTTRMPLLPACAAFVVALAVALLVLPAAIQVAPDLRDLQATLQTAQFEMHALDGAPWYFCH
jgi:hypothetical protein